MQSLCTWYIWCEQLQLIHLMSADLPVESLAGGGAPHRGAGGVAGHSAAGARVFVEGRVGSGLPVPVLTGLRNAANTCGGAAHRVISSVTELRHAGGARVACAVA